MVQTEQINRRNSYLALLLMADCIKVLENAPAVLAVLYQTTMLFLLYNKVSSCCFVCCAYKYDQLIFGVDAT